MARPIKNNAIYFSHDADMRNDPKIKALRKKFGHVGYSVYNMLLEYLTDAEYFICKLTDLNYELLAGDFDIEVQELKNIIDYLVLIDLMQNDNGILCCKTLRKRFEGLLSKRKRERKEVIADDNTQSKEKESILNYSKEDNNKSAFSNFDEDFIDNVIRIFQEEYKQSRNMVYIITNQERERNAVRKLLDIMKEQLPEINSTDGLETMRNMFRQCLSVEDTWLYNNMSLPIIHSQYNQIQSILNNPKKMNNGKAYTYNQLCDLVTKGAEVFSDFVKDDKTGHWVLKSALNK